MKENARTLYLLGALGVVSVMYVTMSKTDETVPQLTKGPSPKTEPADPPVISVDNEVLSFLPMLKRADYGDRSAALGSIMQSIEGDGREQLSSDVRDKTVETLAAQFHEDLDDPSNDLAVKTSTLKIAGLLGGKKAQELVMEGLTSSTDSIRVAALEGWLHGTVNNKAIREKVVEIAKTDLIPDTVKPKVIRKGLGKNSEAELVELIKGADDRATVAAAAVEIQNLRKPELMGLVLARLDETGQLTSHDTMPWFSGRLLAEHIRSTDGEDLERALKVVNLRPKLTKQTATAIREKASHPNPRVRRMVAKLIPGAVKNEGLDATSGEQLLTARLEAEKDPDVKGEIKGSLAEVRKSLTPQPESAAPATP